MAEYSWIIWILLAVLFAIAEVFTSGFVLLWFSIGALFAALLALTHLTSIEIQIVIFIISSIVFTALSRTIFRKYLVGRKHRIPKLGTSSLPGQIGIVVTPSHGVLREGEIKVYGSIWKAFPLEENEELNEGQQVEVVYVEGNNLYVRNTQQRESLWY